jgi:hypothetical protein
MRALRHRLSFVALGWLALASCGGGAASTDGGADTALPLCMSTPKMSVEAFCKIFVASCPLTHEGYTSMSECLTSYTALTTTKPNRQQCQAYHLCQAVDYPAGDDNRANHCGHATGFVGNQACEQDD